MANLTMPFTVLGADLSLSRPAFALLRCTDHGCVELLSKCNIRKKASERRHGPVLDGIYQAIQGYVLAADV